MDWVFLILILAFAVRGWIRGILSQLFAALGMIAGLWVASWVSQWVGSHWQDARPAVFFLLLRMMVVLLAGFAAASVFQWMGERARESARGGPLDTFDGPVGSVLGAGFGAAFVAVVMLVSLQISWPTSVPALVARSRLAVPLMRSATDVCGYASRFSPGWHWLRERFRKAERRAIEAHTRSIEPI